MKHSLSSRMDLHIEFLLDCLQSPCRPLTPYNRQLQEPHRQFQCELLHSSSGYAEYNAVFRTDVFGPQETWVCTRYEPCQAVDYTSVGNDSCGKLDISVTDNGDGTVTGAWTVTRSALTDKATLTPADARQAEAQLETILDWLEHYVSTGEIVPDVVIP